MGLVGRTLAAMALLGTLQVTPAPLSLRPQLPDSVFPMPPSSMQHSPFDTINPPKKVFVHRQVYGLEENLLPYRKHEARILGAVEEFYRRYGIELEFLTAGALPFRPAANHVRLAVMDEDTYYARDARYPKDPSGSFATQSRRMIIKFTGATVEIDPRTISLKILDSDKRLERQEGVAWAVDKSDTIAHELGHLLSLEHVSDSRAVDGPRRRPVRHNLMEAGVLRDDAVETRCGGLICGSFTPEQVARVHEFLSQGAPAQSRPGDVASSRQSHVSTVDAHEDRKTVYVHYTFEQRARTFGFRLKEQEIIEGVRQVYAHRGIDLVFFKGAPPVEIPQGHVRLAVLDQHTYRMTVPGDADFRSYTFGAADRESRVAYVKVWINNFQESQRNPQVFVNDYITAIGHEIGHVLGLRHVEPRTDYARRPNMMEPYFTRCADQRVPCGELSAWQASTIKKTLGEDEQSVAQADRYAQ